MAAPVGNQFWKRRATHGRELLFSSGELLWQAAVEYFEMCDELNHEQDDWVGKDAEHVIRKKSHPYTLIGFCRFVGASESWFKNFRKNENLDDNFLSVITRIEQTIYEQQYSGAVTGIYQQNIIARALGLSDKVEAKVEEVPPIDYDSLSESTLNELASAIKKARPL